jgi:hypothetical protein
MKEIRLTKGKFALVSDRDYKQLSKFKWYAQTGGRKDILYAARRITVNGKSGILYMHREILKPSLGLIVDHANRDTLDNRRSNIRTCTRSNNACNTRLHQHNTSGYRGVSWHSIVKKWDASIIAKGKKYFLGYFNIKEDAARAYNKAALKYHGRFAQLN